VVRVVLERGAPDLLRLVALPDLPQHFAQVRRDLRVRALRQRAVDAQLVAVQGLLHAAGMLEVGGGRICRGLHFNVAVRGDAYP
jgi:hypothetical protein